MSDRRNEPATEDQIRRLEDYGEEIDDGLTYGAAQELLEDYEEGEPGIEQDDDEMYEELEIIRAHDELNEGWWDVYYRPCTLEEVKAAIAQLKQNKLRWSRAEVGDAMQALFPDYRFNEAMRGIQVRYCLPCRGRIDFPDSFQGQQIKCPHCGHMNEFDRPGDAEFVAKEVQKLRPQWLWQDLNDGQWDVYYRPCTLEEVKAAIVYLNPTKVRLSPAEVGDAMQKLFPDYRFNEAMRGIQVRYCLSCRGRIDFSDVQLGQEIMCPHCGHLDVFAIKIRH